MNKSNDQKNGFYCNYGKRGFDLLIALLLLPFISVLIIITTIIILVIERDQVFFKQTRIGLDGTPFTIWKFRTMKNIPVTAGTPLERDWSDGIPDNFYFKENLEDPRITKLGKWLRRLSIDELPQYFNVVAGDMSFVGPRPEVPAFTQYYNEFQNARLNVKPGITGWAQVNGRSDISHGQKIDFDRSYVKNYKFTMDVKILGMTFINLIKREGAY